MGPTVPDDSGGPGATSSLLRLSLCYVCVFGARLPDQNGLAGLLNGLRLHN